MPVPLPGLDPASLLALLIVVPALAAAVVLLPGRQAPALALAAGLLLQALMLAGLLVAVTFHGPVTVQLGGWAPPLGIRLRADGLALAFLVMAAVVMALVMLYGQGERRADREARVFSALLLLLWAGLNTVFLSFDLFNLYVALEIAGLAGVALVALSGEAEALRAQMRYLLFATFGSLLYLLGVAIVYAELGVLDLELVAAEVRATPAAFAALGLMTLGLLLKTAIWPLHFWLPPAHSSAPPAASAVLSALVVKASLYLLLRLWFEVFPAIPAPRAWFLLGLLGAVAVIWGSLLALRQERLKLMIAYSTVAQLGYMLFAFPLAMPGSPVALQAWNGALLQALSHGIAKASMFLSAGALITALGSDRREALVGGSRRVPVPLFALALSGLSIMALPPSGGFVAKWLLLRAALDAGQWWLTLVLIVGGLLAAAYLLRFLLPAFRPVPEGHSAAPAPTGLLSAAALSLAFISVLFGFAADPLLRLLGGPPLTLSETGW